MRKLSLPLIVLAAGGVGATLLATGQALAAWGDFLSNEGALISARAILAAHGDLLTMASLGIPQPPLPYFAAIPFAAGGLPHPALWVSALAGGLLVGWMLYSYRGIVVRHPALAVLLFMIPVLPGVLLNSVTGTATVSGFLLLVVAIQLAARFAIEQQNLREARWTGRLSAWVEPEREQAHAIRFLWAAALALGLASLATPGLLVALPLFLLVTPLLLPPGDRRDLRKITTVTLLLFLPMVTVQALLYGLGWAFGSEWPGFLQPSTVTAGEIGNAGLGNDLSWSLRSPAAAAAQVSTGLLIAGPVLIYVVIRLRNAAVAVLCAIPFVVEFLFVLDGGSALSRADWSLATLLGIALTLLGAQLGRFREREFSALTVATFAVVVFGWFQLADSPRSEERVLARVWRGEDVATFVDERKIAAAIAADPTARTVLLDDSTGYGLIALLGDGAPFVLPHEARFRFALENPQLGASHALLRRPGRGGSPDLILSGWQSLGADKRACFLPQTEAGRWRLLVNSPPVTETVATFH
jgi:hypothetical protein